MNEEIRAEVPFQGIHKWDFRCSVGVSPPQKMTTFVRESAHFPPDVSSRLREMQTSPSLYSVRRYTFVDKFAHKSSPALSVTH